MLKQKFIVDFFSKFGIYLTTAVSGIIVARVAGPEVVGTLAYASAYVVSLSFITSLFGGSYIKLVSEGQDEAKCNKNYLIIIVVSLIIFIFIVLTILAIQKYVIEYEFSNSEMEIVILITLASFIVSYFFQFNEIVFNARTQMANANLPTLLKTITFNIMRVIFVFLGFGAIGLALTNLIAAIIFLPLVIFFLRKLEFGQWDKGLFNKAVKITLPLSGLTIIELLVNNLDKIALEYYSNVEQVGYYSAAFSIGGMLLLISKSTGTIFFPLFSNYFSINKLKEIVEKIGIFQRFFFVIIQPLLIGLAVFSEPIIVFLLGKKFQHSGTLLSLLIFSVYFSIWSIPFGNVITGAGDFKKVLYINLIRFFVFILSLFLFLHIFKLDSLGIALTSIVQNLVLALLFYYYGIKIIKTNFFSFIIKYLLIGLLFSFILFYLRITILSSFNVSIQIFVFLPLSLIAMYSTYSLLNFSNKNDLFFIKSILDFKGIKNYLGGELK